ncbi:MAG: AbrB/MazE/SpoVT family DNA-binding domain-containing protein [Haloferacaceae archaeon]
MSTDDETETTRVTRKGQTTIPKRLREKYDIEPGDEVVWVEDEDGIRLVRADRSAGRGMLAEGMDREAREEAAEKFVDELREARDTEWAID